MSFAASPFLVNHSTVESDGGRAEPRVTTHKAVTLAESLVQLRQCHLSQSPANDSESVDEPNLKRSSKPSMPE